LRADEKTTFSHSPRPREIHRGASRLRGCDRARGDGVLAAGPDASVRFGRCYVTACVLKQFTGVGDEPDVETRLIFGYTF
jgi:hypothetical protein